MTPLQPGWVHHKSLPQSNRCGQNTADSERYAVLGQVLSWSKQEKGRAVGKYNFHLSTLIPTPFTYASKIQAVSAVQDSLRKAHPHAYVRAPC